jgi:cysteinyl-tRNA synthetase
MDNDLNTSLAVTALYDVLKTDANAATKLQAIADMDVVLQLNLIAAAEASAEPVQEETGLDAELVKWIEEKIAARADAKKAKNYAEADAIRAELLAAGIEITDTKDGVKYKKI